MNQVSDCSSQVEEGEERRGEGERSFSLAQENWARRFRWRNHVVTAVAARGFEVSCWRSVEGTCCLSCQRSHVKRGQLRITCLAVSHCHPQGHAGDSKPETRRWWRKAASPIFSVRIWVSRLPWGLGSVACSRRAATL